jgi:hypothetical protein
MSQPPRGIVSAVLLAGLLTLGVTVLRLVGELQGWDPRFFSREPGGGAALVGIGWLMVFVGLWFGRRLAQAGHRPVSTVRAGLVPLLGVVAMMGCVGYIVTQSPKEQVMDRMGMFMLFCPLFVLLAVWGWGRAALAGLCYGLLARVPVVVVQYVAIAGDWGTHYEKMDPSLQLDAATRGHALMMAQLLFWAPLTSLVVTLFAALGALTVRKPAA